MQNGKQKNILGNFRQRVENRLLRFAEQKCFQHGERSSQRKHIIYYCAAWGEALADLFDYALPSILQQGNAPSIKEGGYSQEFLLYTKAEADMNYIKNSFEKLQKAYPFLNFSVKPLQGYEKEPTNEILITALVQAIEECLSKNAIFMMTPPDTIFGNGSLGNAIKLVEGKGICLAAAHSRVDREAILSSVVLRPLQKGGIIENEELVDITFEYAHDAVKKSFDDKDENHTFGGSSIRRINGNMYSIIHNLPTVYLANFTKRDLAFFKKERVFNNWDRGWLRMLFNECRVKFVGSSDLFFCVELTPRAVEIEVRREMLNNDWAKSFNDMRLHNFICNSCCCSWRGRKKEYVFVS